MKYLIGLIAAGLLFAAPAFAQDAQPAPECTASYHDIAQKVTERGDSVSAVPDGLTAGLKQEGAPASATHFVVIEIHDQDAYILVAIEGEDCIVGGIALTSDQLAAILNKAAGLAI